VCYTTTEKIPDSFVRLPLHGPMPEFNLLLVRCKRIMSPVAERLWRLSEEIGEETATAQDS
jgi:hypothetical protein